MEPSIWSRGIKGLFANDLILALMTFKSLIIKLVTRLRCRNLFGLHSEVPGQQDSSGIQQQAPFQGI